MVATDREIAPAERSAAEIDVAATGPGTLGGRYLRRFWQPVYVADDLRAGQAVPLMVMSEQFTLYRGEGGTPHLVDFRCAHRGTQLSTGWVEGDCIRCFYHGWKYDGSGQCVEMPAEDPSFPPKVKIRSYPTEEYLGLIFAYLGEAERGDTGAFRPPPLPRYPEFEGAGGVLQLVRPQIWPCNYFQRLENDVDHVHVAFVHQRRLTSYGSTDVPSLTVRETEYGIELVGRRQGHVRLMHFHMPNVNYRTPWAPRRTDTAEEYDAAGGTSAALSWRVPVDDGHSQGMSVFFVPREKARGERSRGAGRTGPSAEELAEAVLRGELRPSDITDVRKVTNVEDYAAQVGQGAIADRAQDRLGRSDVGVILLRRLWARELQALAEGRSLTDWHRPEAPLAISFVDDDQHPAYT